MPQLIDQCQSCDHPIYIEDNVPGACECLEGGLRQLLARAQRGRGQLVGRDTRPKMARVASHAPISAPTVASRVRPQPLPELSPEMFLSNNALREVQAAAQTQGYQLPTPVDPRRVTTERWSNSRRGGEDIDFDLGMDGAVEAAMNEHSVEPGDFPASFWDQSVAADIGEDALQRGRIEMEDVTFDPPARGSLPDPRGSRFRVDRPMPAPEPFRREIEGPPLREIGQVRGARILTDRGAARDTSRLEAIREQAIAPYRDPNRTPPAMPAKVANAKQEAVRMAEHMRRPTAYDHLMRSDPFEDADF